MVNGRPDQNIMNSNFLCNCKGVNLFGLIVVTLFVLQNNQLVV